MTLILLTEEELFHRILAVVYIILLQIYLKKQFELKHFFERLLKLITSKDPFFVKDVITEKDRIFEVESESGVDVFFYASVGF